MSTLAHRDVPHPVKKGNCYWNTTCFMAELPSWLQSLPSAVKSVCLSPLLWSLSLKNSWMPAAKWPIEGSFFLTAKVATSRCVNSYFSFQQSSFSVSARQTSTSLLLASVCRNYDNIWPNVRWAKPWPRALVSGRNDKAENTSSHTSSQNKVGLAEPWRWRLKGSDIQG